MKKILILGALFVFVQVGFSGSCIYLLYEKKNNKVFYAEAENIQLVQKADYKTFEMLDSGGAARDKKNFYYKGKIVKGIDMPTFEIVSIQSNDSGKAGRLVKCYTPYITEIKDKNGTYSITELEARANGADPKTFEIINDMYYKDKSTVYYNGYNSGYKLPDSDPSTFEVLGDSYSKDKDTVYHHGKKLDRADSQTFILLKNKYAKDKNTIYYYGKKIEESDVSTFEIINKTFSKDKNAVYFSDDIEIEVLEGADSATFELINDNYYKDKNAVYYNTGYKIKKIEEADPNTYKIMDYGYMKDKNAVYFGKKHQLLDAGDYYSTIIIEEADVQTFEVLEYGYSKDKKTVYHDGAGLNDSDPKTVHVLNYLL